MGAFFVSGGVAGLTHRDVLAAMSSLSSKVEKWLSQVGLLPGKDALPLARSIQERVGQLERRTGQGEPGEAWYNNRANQAASVNFTPYKNGNRHPG